MKEKNSFWKTHQVFYTIISLWKVSQILQVFTIFFISKTKSSAFIFRSNYQTTCFFWRLLLCSRCPTVSSCIAPPGSQSGRHLFSWTAYYFDFGPSEDQKKKKSLIRYNKTFKIYYIFYKKSKLKVLLSPHKCSSLQLFKLK